MSARQIWSWIGRLTIVVAVGAGGVLALADVYSLQTPAGAASPGTVTRPADTLTPAPAPAGDDAAPAPAERRMVRPRPVLVRNA